MTKGVLCFGCKGLGGKTIDELPVGYGITGGGDIVVCSHCNSTGYLPIIDITGSSAENDMTRR